MKPAIVIFTFNRPESLRAVLNDLRLCPSFEKFPMYIYIDGARNAGERYLVEETAEIANGFPHSDKTIYQSEKNLGLKRSLRTGVTKVLEIHGSVIVLEDDLRIGLNSLEYFRQGLEKYSLEKQIISICGYSGDFGNRPETDGTYFLPMTHPWGWATWRDRWQEHLLFVEREVDDYNTEFRYCLNVYGLRNFSSMYKLAERGLISSWWIYWHLYAVRRGGLSLFPKSNQVINSGISGKSGTHSSKINPLYKIIPKRSVSNMLPVLPKVIFVGFEELKLSKNSFESRILRLIGFLGSAKRLLRNFFFR